MKVLIRSQSSESMIVILFNRWSVKLINLRTFLYVSLSLSYTTWMTFCHNQRSGAMKILLLHYSCFNFAPLLRRWRGWRRRWWWWWCWWWRRWWRRLCCWWWCWVWRIWRQQRCRRINRKPGTFDSRQWVWPGSFECTYRRWTCVFYTFTIRHWTWCIHVLAIYILYLFVWVLSRSQLAVG